MARDLTYNDGIQIRTDDLTLFGKDGIVIEDPGELVTDIYGLSTVTTILRIPCDRPDLKPAMFSRHPLYPYVALERRRIQTRDGFMIITGEYAGVEGTSASVFELSVGVQDEPIVSHPKFVGSIGGTPSNPLNGAVFLDPNGQVTQDDGIGQFAYFKVTSDFAGIESYLAADFVTWRERYVTEGFVFYNNIGFIDTPSGGPPVTATNWMRISTSIEQRGLCFFITNEWRAGGRRGWNQTIYTR